MQIRKLTLCEVDFSRTDVGIVSFPVRTVTLSSAGGSVELSSLGLIFVFAFFVLNAAS